MKIPKNMVFTAEGITNEAYLKQMQLQEAREDRNPILDKAVELLDAYVDAYDRRQTYGGSRIADDAAVDRAYNGMLRREEERGQAFVARVRNPTDHASRPGLGLSGHPAYFVSQWLREVAEADPGDARKKARAEVIRRLKQSPGDAP